MPFVVARVKPKHLLALFGCGSCSAQKEFTDGGQSWSFLNGGVFLEYPFPIFVWVVEFGVVPKSVEELLEPIPVVPVLRDLKDDLRELVAPIVPVNPVDSGVESENRLVIKGDRIDRLRGWRCI